MQARGIEPGAGPWYDGPMPREGDEPMPVIELTDTNAPDVFFRLTDAQLRSRQEPEKGLLITSRWPC